jgi:hypothetical protein
VVAAVVVVLVVAVAVAVAVVAVVAAVAVAAAVAIVVVVAVAIVYSTLVYSGLFYSTLLSKIIYGRIRILLYVIYDMIFSLNFSDVPVTSSYIRTYLHHCRYTPTKPNHSTVTVLSAEKIIFR